MAEAGLIKEDPTITYELWHKESANLLADFNTMNELCEFVYQMGQVNPNMPWDLTVFLYRSAPKND